MDTDRDKTREKYGQVKEGDKVFHVFFEKPCVDKVGGVQQFILSLMRSWVRRSKANAPRVSSTALLSRPKLRVKRKDSVRDHH